MSKELSKRDELYLAIKLKSSLLSNFASLNVTVMEKVSDMMNEMKKVMDEDKSWKWKLKRWEELIDAVSGISSEVLKAKEVIETQTNEVVNNINEFINIYDEHKKEDKEGVSENEASS